MESPPPSPPPSPPSSSTSSSSSSPAPSPPPQQPPKQPNTREKSSSEVLIKCSITLGFIITTIISTFYAFGFFALLFSIPPSISLHSQCKIVSSSVDLRSSKICELGLLNYKAKRVFYPSERRKFRCRYDYYWASIFKVEYIDHFSGQTFVGLSEAPKEALPSDCRPNFSTAWLTKHVLKVNETYDCWYTSGRSKVEIFHESYFGCQAKDPSLSEMMRRYSILFTKLMQSSWSSQMKSKRTGLLAVLLGAIGGFLTAMISFTVVVVCGKFFCSFTRATTRMIVSQLNRVILSRMFFFVAYFSVVGWLAIQYGKFLGLRELFFDN